MVRTPFSANGHWATLDNALLQGVPSSTRITAIVDREVAADQVCTHGDTFSSLHLAGTPIGLVFAVVHPNDTPVAITCGKGPVHWLGPLSALTQTCSDNHTSVPQLQSAVHGFRGRIDGALCILDIGCTLADDHRSTALFRLDHTT